MYNEPINMDCKAANIPVTEESIQSKVADILNMAKHSRGLSEGIRSNLFGAMPQCDDKEPHISCLEDALNITRDVLKETIETLETVNTRL